MKQYNQPKLGKTKNYKKFKKLFGNRKTIDVSVERLSRNMRKHGWIGTGVIINEHWHVIDGQNRLDAAKIAGIEVPYQMYIGYGTKEMIELNMGKVNWTRNNFLDMYVKTHNSFGNHSDYLMLRQFMDLYGIRIDLAGKMMSGDKKDWFRKKISGTEYNPLFSNGTWKVKTYEKAVVFGQFYLSLQYKHKDKNSFALAMYDIYKEDWFDPKEFELKLRKYTSKNDVVSYSRKDDYIEFIKTIINI